MTPRNRRTDGTHAAGGVRITVRLSPDEAATLDAAAARLGADRSSALRALLAAPVIVQPMTANVRAALRTYLGKRTEPHVWDAAREVLIDAGLLTD